MTEPDTCGRAIEAIEQCAVILAFEMSPALAAEELRRIAEEIEALQKSSN